MASLAMPFQNLYTYAQIT